MASSMGSAGLALTLMAVVAACAEPDASREQEPSRPDASRLDTGTDPGVVAPGARDDASSVDAPSSSSADTGAPAPGTPRPDSGGSNIPTEDAGAPATPAEAGVDLSVELYDPAAFPRFDLELPDASIAALNQVQNAEDERQNSYVRGTLRYGAETIENIGVRLKGEGSFQKLDRKPAFKLKFDEFVNDQAFRGLRRLTLNNAFEDPSFLAERLAYEVFRAAELPAPRCNNASLYINGTFYGVYVNVEAEDKTFLRRWFEDEDGNLYEEGQKDFVPGAETAFNLETNETRNDRSHLQQLIAAIQGATTPDRFLDDVGAHLDTTQFLRFTAAEASVNQWDMYGYTVFYVNNMRIYDDPTRGKFVFLPWGMDMSMKPFRDSRKPFIGLFTLARQGDRANAPISAGLILQRCLASSTCKAAYAKAVEEIIGVYEGLKLESRAMTYFAQIREQVMLDQRKNVCCQGGKLSNAQFEAGFQSVLSTIRGRVAALRADLATR
ncbi:MAG TPA: CotH kinase family protein [Polyangiales bacterium]